MYSSLDRIDIVTKKTETGRHGYVLTDHRTAEEIESEPELSVLFALTRVSGARRMGESEGGADVNYVCSSTPPRFLCEAVASGGGTVTVDMKPLPPLTAARPLGDIADEAFRGLARRVAERERAALNLAFLTGLEDQTLESPPSQDDDEITYWTRAMELAALCGELLREKIGGQWKESTQANGIFPFAFTAGDGTFNVADKAHRFLEQGESQRPSHLLLMADDLGRGEEGPLMVNLKPGDYPREQGVCRDLLEGGPANDTRFPLVFLGRDQPNSFAYTPAGSEKVEEGFNEALRNLARIEIEAASHEIAGVKVVVVSGDFYASEKILDEAFMKGLHRKLRTELLAAAVPYKGLLLVTHEVAPPGISGFMAAAMALHANTEGAPPLSPVVFLVKEGKVVGHVGTSDKTGNGSDEPKKSFWSRLFG